MLDGEWRGVGGHRFLLIDRTYAPGYRHGDVAIGDTLPPENAPWPQAPLLAGAPCRGRMLFVDLETTGIAGGAGTYAFLVGCAWYEGAVFRIRQFFLSTFAAERVLLEAVTDAAASAGTVVTYNGKSFDLPLLETRFAMSRMRTPFSGMPHLDMLHPARRLWRSAPGRNNGNVRPSSQGIGESEGGCRLSILEEALCGHTREGDVPGFEIPSRYFHYVRSGDPRGLVPVMEHNRLDLLSLAMLTARAAQLLEGGAASAATAREALGIGRLYERAGLMPEARAAFHRAADMPGGDALTRAEALRACALLSRRERRYDEAAAGWTQLLQLRGCPPHFVREAVDALAIHHEHRLRDPLAARSFALQSIRLHHGTSRREAVEHRLARLNRKIGGTPAPDPLF